MSMDGTQRDGESVAAEASPGAPRPARKGVDWLTVVLVLVVLLNVGLYLYNRPAARSGGDRPEEPAPARVESPRAEPSPVQGGASPPPKVSLPFLVTPPGLVAVAALSREGGALALKPEQKRQLVAILEARDQMRSTGQSISRMVALMTAEQNAFLKDNRDALRLVKVPAGTTPQEAAIRLLEARAGSAQAPPPVPDDALGAPGFDPATMALGVLLLGEHTGRLALQPEQSAGMLLYLREAQALESLQAQDPAAVLTAAQKRWVEERRDSFSPDEFLGVREASEQDTEVAVRRRVLQMLGR